RGKSFRGATHSRPDRSRRAGRGVPTASSSLAPGKDRRGPGGAAFGRGRHREITADGRASGTPRGRTAQALAFFFLPAAHGQRTLSDHRPDGTRRRTGARRQTEGEARQARCPARTDLNLDPRCRALCPDDVARQRWTLPCARADAAAGPAKNAGSPYGTARRVGTAESSANDR